MTVCAVSEKEAGIPSMPGTYVVTPEIARLWLTTNTHNRNARKMHVAALARDMAAGRWHWTGDPIKFSRDGVLLDGQHRLLAVLKSGASIRFRVEVALDPTAFEGIDANIPRGGHDAAYLAGERNTNLLMATTRLAILWEAGNIANAGSGQRVTPSEAMEFLRKTDGLREAVSAATSMRSRIDLPPRIIAFCIWLFNQVDAEACSEFFSLVAQMKTYGKGDPIAALLQRLRTARKAREYIRPHGQISLVIRAWNAYRVGRAIDKIPLLRRGDVIDIPTPL